MRVNKERLPTESDAAFALASFLLNFLILLVFCVSGWLMYLLTSQPEIFNFFLRDYAIYK